MHVIHDLRLALLVISACLDSLHNRAEAEPLRRELGLIKQLLETSFAMIHELLVSQELRSPVVEVDVHSLIADIEDVVRTIVGSDVTVRTSLAAGWSRVAARRVDLERILLNLVLNAAAAMSAGDELTIETSSAVPEPGHEWSASERSLGTFRLTIRDTGRGMSRDELDAVNTASAHPLADGSGIGLACVSLIVARLGGTLHIGSRDGAGTVVGVCLPLALIGDQVH
jgi:signal transduction histidine kinase